MYLSINITGILLHTWNIQLSGLGHYKGSKMTRLDQLLQIFTCSTLFRANVAFAKYKKIILVFCIAFLLCPKWRSNNYDTKFFCVTSLDSLMNKYWATCTMLAEENILCHRIVAILSQNYMYCKNFVYWS